MPLDPEVTEAIGGAEPEDVANVTPDDVDPSWSHVTYVSGKSETLPTADALALPKATQGPPLAPEGPPPPPVSGATASTPADAERTRWLADQAAQGFHPPGPTLDSQIDAWRAAHPGQDVTPGPLVVRGDSFRPAGSLPNQAAGFTNTPPLPAGAQPQLPPPQPAQTDPGATALAPGGAGGVGETTTTTEQRTEDAALRGDRIDTAMQGETEDLAAQEEARRAGALAETQARDAEQQKLIAAHQREMQRLEIEKAEHERVIKAIDSTPIDEGQFVKSHPVAVAMAFVALATSGFLKGRSRGTNAAAQQLLKSMDDAVTQNIAVQKANKESTLNTRMKLLGDTNTALSSVKMQLYPLLEKHIDNYAQERGIQALPPAVELFKNHGAVKVAEAKNQIGSEVQRRVEEKMKAAPATPIFQRDVELQRIGVDRKAHADAMDPKGADLGGKVAAADRAVEIRKELAAIAEKHGGQLPQQNLISYDTAGLAPLAARAGSKDAADQVRAKSLINELMNTVRQGNTQLYNNVKEVENLEKQLNTGTTPETFSAIDDLINRVNRAALNTASGYSADPQAYVDLVRRTQTSNRGVEDPRDGGAIQARVVRPAPAGAAPKPPEGAESPKAPPPPPTAGGSPATAFQRGTYRRLRE